MLFRLTVLALGLFSPVATYAGTTLVHPAPTLGEIGLIALGLGLAGVGARYLRKR